MVKGYESLVDSMSRRGSLCPPAAGLNFPEPLDLLRWMAADVRRLTVVSRQRGEDAMKAKP